MAFAPDLTLPRFEPGGKAYCLSRAELGTVAWHQAQRVPQVAYEVVLSTGMPQRQRSSQMHETFCVDTSCRRVPVDQSREHA
jgi:hypothetical protein